MAARILSVGSEGVPFQTRNMVLCHAGYEVVPVTSLEQALMLLTREQFGVLLLGSGFPCSDKLLLARGLRRRFPLVAVVVVCKDCASLEHLREEKLCMVEALEGPEALLSAVERCLEFRQLRAAQAIPKSLRA